MSPRNYFFQAMNPDIEKEYHKELSAFVPNIYRGIKNLFSFTPKFNKEEKEDKQNNEWSRDKWDYTRGICKG